MKWSRRQILPHIPSGGVLVDIGCGEPPELIIDVAQRMDFCIGIDWPATAQLKNHFQIIPAQLEKTLPIESELANVVTLIDSLDKLKYPRAILFETFRIMKDGGVLLLTQRAFNKDDMRELIEAAGFIEINYHPLLWGFKTLIRALK